MWCGITALVLTIIITINANWGKIVTWWKRVIGDLNPATGWYILVGIIAVVALWWCWRKKWITWDPARPSWIRALAIACGLTFILKAIGEHERLGTTVFMAYYFTVGNMIISMSVVGVLLASWLIADRPPTYPLRKALGYIILAMVVFMIGDSLLGFIPKIPIGEILPRLDRALEKHKAWTITVLVAVAIIALWKLKGLQKFAFAAGIVAIFGWFALLTARTLMASSSDGDRPAVVTTEGVVQFTISTKQFTPVRFPEGYDWYRHFYAEKEGDKRPVIIAIKKGVRKVYGPDAPPDFSDLPEGLETVRLKAIGQEDDYMITAVTFKVPPPRRK